ncbi:MAG: transglutaminase domain-containing protein [Clostridiales bacterium]|nr:transglutaminase domain-containing protein [Clostridiales bacterium]
MQKRSGRARILLACVCVALFLLQTVLGYALLSNARWPSADGEKKKSDGGLVVDASHADQGYIMAKGPKTSRKLKLRVKFGDQTLDYDLNGEGEYEVIPLQLGSGNYNCTLYKNVSGKKYAQEGRVSVNADMADANTAFLYPNQYVNYNADSAAVKKSAELCAGLDSQQERFDAIFEFIKTGFVYDYVKMVTVKPGMMPDIDECFEKRMGICQDLAAMGACMLRVQGIPAKMMIGTLENGSYHAWVVAVVDGKEILFDPTAELSAVAKNQEYTIERFY